MLYAANIGMFRSLFQGVLFPCHILCVCIKSFTLCSLVCTVNIGIFRSFFQCVLFPCHNIARVYTIIHIVYFGVHCQYWYFSFFFFNVCCFLVIILCVCIQSFTLCSLVRAANTGSVGYFFS